jgi:AraC-like DNA-binding protein
MKYLIVILLLFCNGWILTAAPLQNSSLANIKKQCEYERGVSDYKALVSSSSLLISKARKESNSAYEAYGLFYSGLSKMFQGDIHGSQKFLDQAMHLADELHHDSIKAMVMNARGIYHAMVSNNSFIAQQFFFKALEYAKRAGYESICYRIYGNLLTLSQSNGYSGALKYAISVYNYGNRIGDAEYTCLGTYYIAMYYLHKHRYTETEKYIQKALDIYRSFPYADISSVYVLYAKVMLAKGKLLEAEGFSKKALVLAKKNHQPHLTVDAYIIYAETLYQRGEYVRSNHLVNDALKLANKIGVTNKSVEGYELLSRNYREMGDKIHSLMYLEYAHAILNRLVGVNMDRLTHELTMMQDINRKDQEAEKRKVQMKEQQTFNLMLGIIIFILLALLIVIYVNTRHRNQLYKKIVMQNTKAIARQKELQEMLVRQSEKEKEVLSMDDDKLNGLYQQLCELMEHNRLYTEPQLTRDKMAERLHTNRTYLSKVIKDKTGMNYLQFVNSYRINEAVRILSDKNMISYPLKQIWSDLGFSSPSTFYKVFQQAVGITPSVYRKQFLEMEDHVHNSMEEFVDNSVDNVENC